MEYEQVEANDTRFLFAFYGDMHGLSNPTENSWNLEPGRTMKIVVAVFPGDNLEDLKGSATWARDIYDNPQNCMMWCCRIRCLTINHPNHRKSPNYTPKSKKTVTPSMFTGITAVSSPRISKT